MLQAAPQPQEQLHPCGCIVPQVVATALRKVGVCSECGRSLVPPGSSPDKSSFMGDRGSSQRLQSPGTSPGHYRHHPQLQPFSQQPANPVPMSSAPPRQQNGHGGYQGANGVTPPMSMPGHMHGAGARMLQRQEDAAAAGGASSSVPTALYELGEESQRETSSEMHGDYGESGSDVVMHVTEKSSGYSSSLRAGREWLRWGSSKAESMLASSKATGSSSKGTLRSSGRSERNLHGQALADPPHNGAQTAPLVVKSGDVVSPPGAPEDSQQRANQGRTMHAAHASHAQFPNSVRGEFSKDRGAAKVGPPNMNVRTVRSSGTQSSGGEASQKLPEALRDVPPNPGPGPAATGGTGPTYVRPFSSVRLLLV